MKILSLTISDWYWLSQIASVVLLGLTVVSGIGAIVTGKVLNARQSKEIEELKLKRVELERSLAPRTIPFEFGNGKTNVDRLRKFSGTEMIVEFLPDAECVRAALNIMQLAQMAGWKTVRSEPLKFEPGLAFPEGVVVRPYSSDATAGPNPRNRSEEENRNEVSSNRAADELVAFLNSYNWEASKALGWKQNIPPNTIKVTVGLKPLPYFQPPEIKRVKDQVRQIEQQLRQQEEKH